MINARNCEIYPTKFMLEDIVFKLSFILSLFMIEGHEKFRSLLCGELESLRQICEAEIIIVHCAELECFYLYMFERLLLHLFTVEHVAPYSIYG